MKKLLFLFIFCLNYVNALDTQSTLNIYHEIFSSLLDTEKFIVYTNDKELHDVFKYSKKIVLSDNIRDADIILVSSKLDVKRLKDEGLDSISSIIFATKYRLLKESDHIIGAFYWKKGRSQLLFIKHRLDKYKIHLPSKYRAFMVDEL